MQAAWVQILFPGGPGRLVWQWLRARAGLLGSQSLTVDRGGTCPGCRLLKGAAAAAGWVASVTHSCVQTSLLRWGLVPTEVASPLGSALGTDLGANGDRALELLGALEGSLPGPRKAPRRPARWEWGRLPTHIVCSCP